MAAADFQNARCRARELRPHSDVELFTVEGHLDLEGARWIEARTEDMLRGGRIHVFHDWSRLDGYDTASREHLTDYTMRIAKQLLSATVLVRSALVAMGVQFAGWWLRDRIHLRGVSDPAQFKAALRAVGVDWDAAPRS
jgi:hypothetical protein